MIGRVSDEVIGTTFMTHTFKSFKAAANLKDRMHFKFYHPNE